MKNLQHRQEYAINVMREHGLKNWHFKFDKAKTRAGQCSYYRKQISIARAFALLVSDAVYMDTVAHEVAHALTEGHGHNKIWRTMAIRLGSNGKRCHETDFTKPKWYLVCSNDCFEPMPYQRKSKVSRKVCRKCKSHVFFVSNSSKQKRG